ncbi:CBK1 kinase activator protein Mob2p [[Candida] anglica]|uniref:CBK1 kinase activator protein Mob2p n=1 Tax=[Candida] anglica TaxID=148631 RepID=A0ABP0E5X8_9ASCO
MSFLNTIRGLGRSSKKNKKDLDVPTSIYSHPNSSGSTLRRSQSPTKSPSRQRNNQYNKSPTKARTQYAQQQHQQQHQLSSQQAQLQHQQQSQLSSTPLLDSTTGSIIPDQSGRKGTSGNTTAAVGGNTTSLGSIPTSGGSSALPAATKLPLFLCEPFVKTALVKGSFKTIVQLPKYVDYGEWVALNIFESFNNLNQFYGIIAEYVTPEAYPTMNAGPYTNYMWVDGSGQMVNLPAGTYIDYVLTWISNKINDQSVFPTKSGGAFPPNFLKDCKNISRQMFRIFAHIYHNHFEKIVHLSLEAHWNSFFSHFISFVKEFGMIERAELDPLLPLIENLEQQGKIV